MNCRQEELDACLGAATATGIVMDPVYSGKALHQWMQDVKTDSSEWEGSRVLFIHTGGLLGMYDKCAQLQGPIEALGKVSRLETV
jgi:D-cysteine desulfhydrase